MIEMTPEINSALSGDVENITTEFGNTCKLTPFYDQVTTSADIDEPVTHIKFEV